MSTLVTGASGFIGRRLLRKGERALVRGGDLPGAVCGDLFDPGSLQTACSSIDTVFHCAGYAHAFNFSDPELHWRVNFEGTRNLVDMAGKTGVRRFVFLSSVKAMAEPGELCVDEDWPGEPVTPYGRAKRAAEAAVMEAGVKYGMHVVILRLAMVYGRGGRGNLERMAQAVRKGWFPPIPETGNRRSLVHIEDVVSAMRCVAADGRAAGRTYIIAGPEAPSGRQLYDALRQALALPPSQWSLPPFFWRAGGWVGDWVNRLSSGRVPLDSAAVERLLSSAWYAPARIERELGWRAKTSLADGLREMLGK